MRKTTLVAILSTVCYWTAWAADGQWVFEQSTLTYHVSHPLHQTDGISHAARGKGVCHAGQCDFLIAVPVKSFDSGDSNRDRGIIDPRLANCCEISVLSARYQRAVPRRQPSTQVRIKFLEDIGSHVVTKLYRECRSSAASASVVWIVCL